MPSQLWREQQERIYRVGFYGGGALLLPLAALALFSRHLPNPLRLAAAAFFAVFGILLFGYLGALIVVNARQGIRETRARRAGCSQPEADNTTETEETSDAVVQADPQEQQHFWTYRRVLLLCALVGIIGSLMRIGGWWAA